MFLCSLLGFGRPDTLACGTFSLMFANVLRFYHEPDEATPRLHVAASLSAIISYSRSDTSLDVGLAQTAVTTAGGHERSHPFETRRSCKLHL